MSSYSALSMNVLLTLKMQLVKDALFLKDNFSSYALLSESLTVIVPLTTIYVSLQSQKSDLSINVLNLICSLCLHLSSALPE